MSRSFDLGLGLDTVTIHINCARDFYGITVEHEDNGIRVKQRKRALTCLQSTSTFRLCPEEGCSGRHSRNLGSWLLDITVPDQAGREERQACCIRLWYQDHDHV
jgi:hypothetical protein